MSSTQELTEIQMPGRPQKDSPITSQQVYQLFFVTANLFIFGIYAAFFYSQAKPYPSLALVAVILFSLLVLLIRYQSKVKYKPIFFHLFVLINYVGFLYLALATGGFSSKLSLWLISVPVAALALEGKLAFWVWSGLVILGGGILYAFEFSGTSLNTVWSIALGTRLEDFSVMGIILYLVSMMLAREGYIYQLKQDIGSMIARFQRENRYLKKQIQITDSRNFRLVQLYQNLKQLEITEETKTELMTEAALALNMRNREIQEVMDNFMKQSQRLGEINEDLTNSIRYAQRIQEAITPDRDWVLSHFRDAFIFYQPKDIVSGDFLWFAEKKMSEGHIKILIAADCTGHGVPGAFMTVMGNSLINEIVQEMQVIQPDLLLQELDRKIISTLSSKDGRASIHDGMDMAVLMIDDEKKLIHYAAAHNPLYYVRKQTLHQVKGSRFAVGSSQYKTEKKFKLHTIQAEPGDVFYIFTDGFQDQFGEKAKRKYMTRRFRNFLLSLNRLPLEIQGRKVKAEFEHWKGNLNQTDDILIVGFRM